MVWLVILSGLWLSGCARLRPGIKPPEAPAEAKPALEIHTQYAVSSEPKLGYNTFEVYIANHTTNTIVFTAEELNGKPLPKVQSPKAGFPDDSPVTWWQYYPGNEVKPGATIEFQVNFKTQTTGRQELRLLTAAESDSTSIPNDSKIQNQEAEIANIVVPRFRQPKVLITAITFPLDYAKVYIQYQSQHDPPVKVFLNNREVADFIVLPSLEPDTADMLAFLAPFKITAGMPLHVQLWFRNGISRQALVRALSGVLLGAYNHDKAKAGEDLGLDPDPPVISLMGGDVACFDVHKGTFGAAAAPVIEERRRLFQQQSKLSAIHYCTAMYPELWNIYGQISDAAFASPYCLASGQKPSRFIDEEEKCLEKARLSARPRPLLWIPEAFKQGKRFLEPPELEIMTWISLVRGCKGIKYFAYKFKNNAGFADCPPLKETIKRLNREVHGRQKILSPLVLVSERTEGDEAKGYVKIYESWSGDKGILLMIRNLDYTTDAKSNEGGKEPRFKVQPKNGLNMTVSLPEWFEIGAVQQWRGSVKPEITRSMTTARINIKQLNEFEIIWMQNKNYKN